MQQPKLEIGIPSHQGHLNLQWQSSSLPDPKVWVCFFLRIHLQLTDSNPASIHWLVFWLFITSSKVSVISGESPNLTWLHSQHYLCLPPPPLCARGLWKEGLVVSHHIRLWSKQKWLLLFFPKLSATWRTALPLLYTETLFHLQSSAWNRGRL